MKEKKQGMVTNKNKEINHKVNFFMKLIDEFVVFKSKSALNSDGDSYHTHQLMLRYF